MFQDKLRYLRLKKGLTQSELAKAIGVSPATIGNYEQGTRTPKNEELWKKIADYFEITVDELMDNSAQTTTSSLINPNSSLTVVDNKEHELIKSLCQHKKDQKIIYEGVDITPLVFAKNGETISTTLEISALSDDFIINSGHVKYARKRLLQIIYGIKKTSREDIIANISTYAHKLDHDVAYWFKRCWNNIDHLFPKITNIETLYDYLEVCLFIDKTSGNTFYLADIPDDFDWLREHLR